MRTNIKKGGWIGLYGYALAILVQVTISGINCKAKQTSNLQNLNYRIYPRRSEAEATVIEWGSSAIISAVDASVAHFGPQTSQAALMEVETMPVVASPVNGRWETNNTNVENEKVIIQKLDNADEVHGNVVVMTNTGGLTGVEMARVAQLSGAAALMVVNVDEDRPDDIYRLPADEGAEQIDIPVVMISLNSANVLTAATVTEDMKQEDIVNNGLPERIRLYAGGDRPFFEDVEAAEPTIYIIHNLLTKKECDSLIEQATPLVAPIIENDTLQLTQEYEKFVNVQRVMLWDGLLKSPERKSVEDRVEQVTGFPADHYSDFIIDRLEPGSYWQPHYDTIDGSVVPLVTIIVFLSAITKGGEIVYPSVNGDPIKVKPTKGLAVVHHNTDAQNRFEVNSLHALLPVPLDEVQEYYIARKFILPAPVSRTRRLVLPILAAPYGGKLPQFIPSFYRIMIAKFGQENGDLYFDNVFIISPIIILLLLAQIIANFAIRKWKESSEAASLLVSKKKKTTTVIKKKE